MACENATACDSEHAPQSRSAMSSTRSTLAATVEVLPQRMHSAGPVIVEDEAPRVGMTVRLDTQEVLHLALVPVRCGQDARHRRKRRPRGVDLRLDGYEPAGGQREDVVEPV